MTNVRCEVWGSPIQHSKSPRLHRAAYEALGLDWTYQAREVDTQTVTRHFRALNSEVRGLSVTMPLKTEMLRLVVDHRGPVTLLQAANTVARSADGGWFLDNTDWWGAWRALEDFGGTSGHRVWLLGGGATARSVLYALARGGATSVTIVVRDLQRSQSTFALAKNLGLHVEVCRFADLPTENPDWVISTLPGGVAPQAPGLARAANSAHLFDIAYDPWPTSLAQLWAHSDRYTVSGLRMLAYQALAQVRAFVSGDSETELTDEENVRMKMWVSVGLGNDVQSDVKQ